ncbi:hypothetical protein BC830DRAFT_263381 [Chytriomyces sp. MP71]|nr:hypothetical protein BC830DRAFT_263381 [Chytriomyces sp. MP71]
MMLGPEGLHAQRAVQLRSTSIIQVRASTRRLVMESTYRSPVLRANAETAAMASSDGSRVFTLSFSRTSYSPRETVTKKSQENEGHYSTIMKPSKYHSTIPNVHNGYMQNRFDSVVRSNRTHMATANKHFHVSQLCTLGSAGRFVLKLQTSPFEQPTFRST